MTSTTILFEATGENTLRATCELAAPPERVFDAWADPDEFAKWFCQPDKFVYTMREFDCRVGGRYDVSMRHEDGDHFRVSGEYRQVERPFLLSFSWQWEDRSLTPEETLVTVELSPKGNGTMLRLTHERFVNSGARDKHSEGWSACLNRLSAYADQM